MNEHKAAGAIPQAKMVRAFDPELNRMVMIPEAEAVEIKVVTGLKSSRDGWLMTPTAVRQLGWGRSPFRDYPSPEDPRLAHLMDMVPPGTLQGESVTTYWQAIVLRADGVRQTVVLTDLADARDELFDGLSLGERLDLAAPFLGRQEAA